MTTTALRIYLVLVFLANLAGTVHLAVNRATIMGQHPKLNSGLVTVLLASGLASLVAVVLMWRWQRPGIYLIAVAYGVMLLTNVYYEAPLAHTLLGPLGLAVLFLLLWPVRQRFRSGQAAD